MSLDCSVHEVLSQYSAALRDSHPTALGNHGGFSGATLWRLDCSAGSFALKAWPEHGRSAAELGSIHALMQRAEAMPWMPRVQRTSQGATLVIVQGRLWEVQTWMPGRADFSQAPSQVRLDSAVTALAQLHQIWAPVPMPRGVCPAVLRRWESWRIWNQWFQSGWRPVWNTHDPYTSVAKPLWTLILKWIDEVPHRLSPWLTQSVLLQPCICDVWHDHVLYEGERVSGLIDFGSVKEDHVAVDLARLLGSMVGSNATLWLSGIAAYRKTRLLSVEEEALAHALDHTGIILAATHWLRWLYLEGRRYQRPEVVVNRLQQLVQRLTEW